MGWLLGARGHHVSSKHQDHSQRDRRIGHRVGNHNSRSDRGPQRRMFLRGFGHLRPPEPWCGNVLLTNPSRHPLIRSVTGLNPGGHRLLTQWIWLQIHCVSSQYQTATPGLFTRIQWQNKGSSCSQKLGPRVGSLLVAPFWLRRLLRQIHHDNRWICGMEKELESLMPR